MSFTIDILSQAKVTSALHNNYSQHHLHPLSHAIFQRKPQWQTPSIPAQAKTKNNFTMPTRREIVDWFLSLPQHEFLASTIIDNSSFIDDFFKNYGKGLDVLIHLPTQRWISCKSSAQSSHTLTILDWIRYAPTYTQQLYLSPETSSAQILLEWLEDITQKRIFQLPLRSMNRDSPEQNLLWFNNQTFHSLPEWLANQFEKSILRYYFTKVDRYEAIPKLKQYMQQKGSGKLVTHMLEISLAQVKQGTIEKSRELISKLRSFEDKMEEEFQAKLFNLTEEIPKRRKKRKLRHKRSASHEKLNNFDERTNQLEQSSSIKYREIDSIKISQLGQIRNLVHSHHNDGTSHSIQDVQQSKNTQLQMNPEMISPIKSISKKSQKTCCGQCSQEQFDKHQDNGDQFDHRKLSIVEQLMSETNEETKKKRKRKATKNTKIVEQFKEKVTHKLLNKQFDSFLDTLSAQSNANYESKVLTFERIRYFVKSIFPQAEAILFGSNAVGLALPTSDIDIMLTGLQYSSKDQLCDYLAQIGVYINSMGWVVSCSTYLSAKVPLLKLEIDTSIKYFTPKIKLDYQQAYDPYLSYFLNLRDPTAASIIKVDITISLDSSLTSPSTELMRNWLFQKPSIQRILLALKYTLSIRGYNQNFKGGIGSYCLFVMVSAYFQHFNQKRQLSDCEILLDILKFYGQQFDNHMKIIHLTNNLCCFFTNQEALQQFQLTEQLIFTNPLKILDPLNRRLMSSSCHQYSMIKAEWRKIRQNILKIGQQIEEETSTSFTNTTDMTKLLTNNKAFEKWIHRLQGRMETSVGAVLKGAF